MGNPYITPGRVRAALNTLNLRPSRDLGQNFLIDAQVLQQIVAAAALTPEDVVIEVGPGLGALTYELVQHAGKVYAIELDRRLAARLRDEFRAAANLEVVQADVLRVDPATLVGAAPYKVVANLPYQITSAALRHFLEAVPAPQLMVVMVQREVAERIVAQPPDMSVLAHAVQFYAEPSIVARVPAEAFLPAPKVDSAVLRLVRRPQPPVAVDDVDAFFRTIKAGFLQARKKLANALPGGLAGLGLRVDKEAVVHALVAAGVDPNRRAETLTLQEWARVHAALGPLLAGARAS
ncbi:16S rRNA (adenine(1518)-N(6)/adenine(1519)-N(6))-dimethyltransferase RsmA [Kallotenue papyrolyticum]|uniref:16S rRNA (adenine(1518)-N(6)/adenine(1519)-N(6))- dimethyltransferase RsmA n=1 Tax=Kallotenue papyrolyticum TaxID=1325125 RepID=UPI00047860BF|nr:16S rRNA (adenine(1518)-N(6)/adenine(1519)-N(6))-dimethyltransferase RsmA [Kallotenue papyrolyticum]